MFPDESRTYWGLPAAQDLKRTPLVDFTLREDGPWHPAGLVQPAAASNPQHCQSVSAYGAGLYNYSGYRSPGLPSECDTLPGDSAYGSIHQTFSQVESAPSIFGDDRCADTERVEQLIVGLSVGPDGPLPYGNRPVPPSVQSHIDEPPTSRHHCEECNLSLKTKSELTKHFKRHSKPHKCSYSNCRWGRDGEGFTTQNDLIRHKRTVHREHSGSVYVCRHPPCATKKQKLWPRADNFRNHLARTHSIPAYADLGNYLYRQAAERPLDLQGVGSSVAELDPDSRPMQLHDSPGLRSDQLSSDVSNRAQQDFSSQMMQPLQQHPVPEEDESQFIQPDVLSELEVDRVSGHPLTNVNIPEDEVASPQTDDGGFALMDAVMGDTPADEDRTNETRSERFHTEWWETSQAEPSSEPSRSEMDTLSNSTSESQKPSRGSNDSSLVDSLSAAMAEIRPDDPRLLDLLKSLPKNLLQTALKGDGGEGEKDDPPLRDESNIKASHVCSDCNKRFYRQCELTKHKKRHAKPYGCTFRSCSKSFGSKNDWKRHESSQHYQLEIWNCDLPECRKVCHRRETFKSHLHKDHQLENNTLVDDKLESCRLGRHCDPRFWCGFCMQIIEIKQIGVNSWTKRCDHIDNHLFGKEGLERKPMSEWCYAYTEDDEVVKEQCSGQPSSNALNRSERASEGNARKRKGEKDVEPRKRKKSSREGTYVWRCCNCSQYMNYKTSNCCIDCDHPRCNDNCMLESVSGQEQDVEPAMQEMDGL